jgi:hypothetical protein
MLEKILMSLFVKILDKAARKVWNYAKRIFPKPVHGITTYYQQLSEKL